MILGIIAGGMRRVDHGYYGIIASTFAKTSKYANDYIIDFRAPSTTYPALWHQNYDETNSFGLYVTTESTDWTPTGGKTFNCSPNDVFTLQVNNGSSSDTISTMSLDFMTEDNTVLYRILYTKQGFYSTNVLAGPPSALVERKGDKLYPNPKGKLTLSQSEVSWVDSQPSTSNTYTPPFTSSVDLSQLKKLRVYNLRSKAPGSSGTYAYLIQDHRSEQEQFIHSLFAQGQQGFWLPFTDFASLSQDSAGTLPYTALEQPVGRVLDRSGRGNHASQATSTARPKITQAVGEPKFLTFDGVDDRLQATLPAITGTWIVGYKQGTLVYKVNIPAGAFPIGTNSISTLWSPSKNFVGMVLRSGDLTEVEISAVERYLVANGAGAAGVGAFAGVTNFQYAWTNCSSLTSFPLINTSAGTNFTYAWTNCSSLTSFPSNMFDSCPATNFTAAFQNCALSQGSVDGILASLVTAGKSNGTLNLHGGTSATPSAAGLASKATLVSRGWTVTHN